jgi:hypothetical protein
MDVLIGAAARALAAGDPLGALNQVALRDDAPALALRGIAMAQLGDLARARILLRDAARAFGPKQAVARARCVVAEAEVALAARDLAWPGKALDVARTVLDTHGDHFNAAHARCLQARRSLLMGQLDKAAQLLQGFDSPGLPPPLRAARELVAAGVAARRMQARTARAALAQAGQAAAAAAIPALQAEVRKAVDSLDAPAARLVLRGQERGVTLDEVEDLLSSETLVVDACRNTVRKGATAAATAQGRRDTPGGVVALASRPVLFALARALAQAWPGDASRDTLIVDAFRTRYADETHRARLRVEIGRLRALLRPLAGISATPQGFVLEPLHGADVAVLAQPEEGDHAQVLACLADGESWSSSALALAMGSSQRTVQRALDALAAAGKVQSLGGGRARRWMTPLLPGFATVLLLPVPPQGY